MAATGSAAALARAPRTGAAVWQPARTELGGGEVERPVGEKEAGERQDCSMTDGPEQERCPKCDKAVYDAEGFPAGMKERIIF